MNTALSNFADGIAGEIAFLVVSAVILLPFSAVDALILKKIHAAPNRGKVVTKKYNAVKSVVSCIVMAVVAVCVGCIIEYGFHVSVLEEDLVCLGLIVAALGSFALTLTVFDFFAYKKITKENAA